MFHCASDRISVLERRRAEMTILFMVNGVLNVDFSENNAKLIDSIHIHSIIFGFSSLLFRGAG